MAGGSKRALRRLKDHSTSPERGRSSSTGRNGSTTSRTKASSQKGWEAKTSNVNESGILSKNARISKSKDGSDERPADQSSRNSNERPSPRPESVSRCDGESSKVTRSEAFSSVSSQRAYRPRGRPSFGLDKATVQGRRRTSSVFSLEQEDAKNLLEQRPERVKSELRRSAAVQEREHSNVKMLLSGRKRSMRINSTSTRR